MAESPYLVSTDWLAEHLASPDIIIVDGTYYLPNEQRDAKAEYLQGHLPGALFFDIDDISDDASDMPHMLPSPAKFSSRMRKMGIGDGKRVIAYDARGMFSAARVWWTFRAMGHEDVAVLDGGLPKWTKEGRPLEDGAHNVQERHFTARKDASMVRDLDDIAAIVGGKGDGQQIVDARAAPRFRGEAPEPRAGLRSGHMPGAFNVPFPMVLNADGTFKTPQEIRHVFEQAGVDFDAPIVTSCGSGVTAAVLSLALAIAGHNDNALYDGSWAEWGLEGPQPVAAGA